MKNVSPLIIGIVTVLTASCMTAGQTRPNDLESNVEHVYLEKWNGFLLQFESGARWADLKAALPRNGEIIGVKHLGGSGRSEWVYRIDDFNELSVAVDKDEVLTDAPRLRPRSKWRRFPDGSIVEDTDKSGATGQFQAP